MRIVTQPIRDEDGTIIGALEAFTDDSSLTTMRARLADMERLAMIDPLTEVPNRRFLEMALTSRLGEVRRFGLDVSVVMLDIDDFKSVNDRFGHAVGDSVLRMVATVLAANERAEDLVARLAGDEFVIVLQHTDAPRAAKICERLRVLIEGSELDDRGAVVRVTASFGVTAVTPEDDVDTVLRRADELLYAAKARHTRPTAVRDPGTPTTRIASPPA